MKQIQCCLSVLLSFLLLSGTSELFGCTSSGSTTARVVQDPAPAPNPQTDQSAQTPQDMQLPQVDLTADGLDELLAPVALYPDPVLAILLQAAIDPQEVMDGGNWLALDENQSLRDAA